MTTREPELVFCIPFSPEELKVPTASGGAGGTLR